MKTFQRLHLLLLMLFVVLLCSTVAADNPTSSFSNGASTVITTHHYDYATTTTARATAEAAAVAEEGEEHTKEEKDEGDAHPYYAVVFPWVSTAIGICIFYFQTRHFHLLPYTCVMFIIGVFMGVGAVRSGFHDQLTESIAKWSTIHYETLFVVFLPGLLMKDALEVRESQKK